MIETGEDVYIPLVEVSTNAPNGHLLDTAKGREIIPAAQISRHLILIVDDLDAPIVGKAAPIGGLDRWGILDRTLLVDTATREHALVRRDMKGTPEVLVELVVRDGTALDALQMPVGGAIVAGNERDVISSGLRADVA